MSAYGIDSASQPAWERTHSRMSHITGDNNRNRRPARILIADDHAILRDGLRALLHAEPDFRVIGEAADADTVVRLVQEIKPEILLLDWTMSRQDGMRILREVAALEMPVRTMLLTVVLDKTAILQALQLGVWGVVLKSSTTDMLFEGIRKVVGGQYWIGQESVANLVDALRDFTPLAKIESAHRDFGLTHRELEIVAAVVAGYSNADIAASATLSEHTVKHHISNIFDKLGVSNRLELALFAVNHQMVA